MRQTFLFLILTVSMLNTFVLAMPVFEKECDTIKMDSSALHHMEVQTSIIDCMTSSECDSGIAHCQSSAGTTLVNLTVVPTLKTTTDHPFQYVTLSLLNGYFKLINPPPISL